MSYSITGRWGGTNKNPHIDTFRKYLDELDSNDSEHPDTWLTHLETGWTLSCFGSGLVVWENVEGDCEPKHLLGVSPEKMLDLWQKLSLGEIEPIETESWLPGYR